MVVDRRGARFILDTSPPKPTDDGSEFFNEGLGEEDSAHVVDWDGGLCCCIGLWLYLHVDIVTTPFVLET